METLVAYCALLVLKEKALTALEDQLARRVLFALKEATASTASDSAFGFPILLLSSKSVHSFRVRPGFTHWCSIWTIKRDGKGANIASMSSAIFVPIGGSVWSR